MAEETEGKLIEARAKVCAAHALPDGRCQTVQAFGTTVAVFRQANELYAIDDCCPHRGGPLSQGTLEGRAIVCPLHAWTFDLKTGQSEGGDSKVSIYPIEIDGDDIYVKNPTEKI